MPCKGIALPAELPARSFILYNNKSRFVNLLEGMPLNSGNNFATLSAILKQRSHHYIKILKGLIILKGYGAVFRGIVIFRKIHLRTTEKRSYFLQILGIFII